MDKKIGGNGTFLAIVTASGVALGSVYFNNLALGITSGALIGATIDAVIYWYRHNKNKTSKK